MFKIRVKAGTVLSAPLIDEWIGLFKTESNELATKLSYYLNKDRNGKNIFKLPYAKKLVLTAAATTAAGGVEISSPDLQGAQKNAFDEVKKLFERQSVSAHDMAIIKDGCIFGRAYELVYMSNDDVPVPKVAKISATNAFVVYDDTVEMNSLFGVYFETLKDEKGDSVNYCYVYDQNNSYTYDDKSKVLSGGVAHPFGRVPLTEYQNNDEEQCDFEQVIDLMKDRTTIHNNNIKDVEVIAKNYLKLRNVDFTGRTPEEKAKSIAKAKELHLLEFETDNETDDMNIISKAENYASVDVFGKDIDRKIYDLTLIPDLSDDNFAGNLSGVALNLKLQPFKELVKTKDFYVKRLYRRRIKMYMNALLAREQAFEVFDVSDVKIETNRTWAENTLELAQIVSTLAATGLFSDEYLVNKMPDANYATEQSRHEKEIAEKSTRQTVEADPNNFSLESFVSLMRGNNGV